MKMSILEYLYNTVTKLTLIKFPKSNAKLHPIVPATCFGNRLVTLCVGII